MAYRNKEACLAEAGRLGLDVEGMSWSELQKTVSDALKLEELGKDPQTEKAKVEDRPYKETRSKAEAALDPYIGKTIVLSPELAPERYRLLKYDEELGDELEVVERKFDLDNNDNVFDVSGNDVSYDNAPDSYHDYTTGTYKVKGSTGRKVTATASVPKENAGMVFRPGIDVAVVVTWKGRSGYLWNHWRYPNVKALLKQSGYYNKYKGLFVDEPNVWYAAGQLVCDPYLVHRVLDEIEAEEREKQDIKDIRSRIGGVV